jgi:hypothetical protein
LVIAMIRRGMHLSRLILVVFIVGAAVSESDATEYVWARSGYGALPTGHNGASFSNGYGGYYVPRNAYGNNYETRRPYTNPNGFIVPATPQQATVPSTVSQPQTQSIPMRPSLQQKLKRFWSH